MTLKNLMMYHVRLVRWNMNKEEKLWLALITAIIIIFGQAFVIGFGVNLINDLKATANGYESDRNLCRSQLDSLTQDYERLQNE